VESLYLGEGLGSWIIRVFQAHKHGLDVVTVILDVTLIFLVMIIVIPNAVVSFVVIIVCSIIDGTTSVAPMTNIAIFDVTLIFLVIIIVIPNIVDAFVVIIIRSIIDGTTSVALITNIAIRKSDAASNITIHGLLAVDRRERSSVWSVNIQPLEGFAWWFGECIFSYSKVTVIWEGQYQVLESHPPPRNTCSGVRHMCSFQL
jgi:hypothetical protein